ncbi:MAG: hypothetical protein V2I37_05020 [Marinilabiliaceae bacterium]|jgi:hypothetical protein|nr:hypothetical protein [Marinilabiliaceae bacterium]
MKYLLSLIAILFLNIASAQEKEIFPGADENSPSRAQYFSWINNTNEGATMEHTMVNLDFFDWLKKEYGMQLDIYAFDAGAIDGKRFYGSIYSDRFKKQFPGGFDPIYKRAEEIGIRLGIWGGPDGFGNTEKEARERIDQMVKLCRDYNFALFKFDAVCGPLRPEKEDYFIEMMTEARKYSPDLILLNHRLGLNRAKPYATTFLMGGAETYIDVFMNNNSTAPHHRAGALARGLSPDLMRLTEDHGVCISSCIDYWDDDLVLQAFNRSLILAPQVYGNPWLMRDDEFPKLARIYNLHRKYRDILINGITLPDNYGPNAVSRGNEKTRIITLRNLSWETKTYNIKLDSEIGLGNAYQYYLRQFHPAEKVLGIYRKGESVPVSVLPFRSYMLIVSAEKFSEPGIIGAEYELVKNIETENIEIDILGMPGSSSYIQLEDSDNYSDALLNGEKALSLMKGRVVKIDFPGEELKLPVHRKLGIPEECNIPEDAEALYEATVFAADNNALEVRSLLRSGPTKINEVKAAREAFFNQAVFLKRGIWDRNLFDNDMQTGFFPSRKYKRDQRIEGGCFRLDLGQVIDIDSVVLYTADEYSLQPLLKDEGNFVEVSKDLLSWETLTYLAGERMPVYINGPVRYFRFKEYADRLVEIRAYKDGVLLNNKNFRASNLFAHPSGMTAVKTWKLSFTPDEISKNSYFSVAINGKHGKEGAYAAMKVDGKLVGAPDRARSYQSNTWEYVNAAATSDYTYYFPAPVDYAGKEIEIFIFAYQEDLTDLSPEVWISAGPSPYEKLRLTLSRK